MDNNGASHPLQTKIIVRLCFPLINYHHYERYYRKKLAAFKHDNILFDEVFEILRMGLSTDGIAVDIAIEAPQEDLDIILFYLEKDFSIPVMLVTDLPDDKHPHK